DQIISEAKTEADRLKEKAHQDIAQNKAEALADVKGEVADLTVLLAEKIMVSNLDKEAQSNLIDSYIKKLGDA
ncbi:F0F1 ATP synthase subunit B family protein, partial [Streptococcus agalactiae]